MSSTAFVWLRRFARHARQANGANVTVTFALATVPLVGFVGAAVDFSHANSVRVAMQAAVDGTALMLPKQAASLNQTDLQPKADAYFKALFNRPEATGVTVSANYTTEGGSKVVIAASATVKADFIGLMGVKQVTLGAQSVAKWGNTKLRVALALDTTGSMWDDGKMDALKPATKSLLKQLKAAAAKDGDVYVSIIPFSKDVRFGKSHYQSDWIRWDLWDEKNGWCSNDDYDTKSQCENKGKTWTVRDHKDWNGCVTDRDQDYDTKNTAPDINVKATLFPAEQ